MGALNGMRGNRWSSIAILLPMLLIQSVTFARVSENPTVAMPIPGTPRPTANLSMASAMSPGACCAAPAALADRSIATELSMLLDTSDFPPRWRCGTWSRPLGLLHIVSDITIFFAYVMIPVTLAFFIRKRKDLPFSKLFWLFGAFIIFCGLTHLMEAIIFYWPAYRVAGLLKLCTAIVSVVTSIALIRIIPKALQLKSPTELQSLVDQQTHELLHANDKLIAANEQLAQAKKTAELANRTKSDFLANMSHEIRTPMTAILGFTEILSEQTMDPEAHQAIETVRRNGRHLLHVVNDILDLSKIEADQLEFESIPISPTQLIQDVCTLHEGLAASKGLALRCEISPRVPAGILADATRINQILSNLISNAIKFTDAGSIRVRARVKSTRDAELLCIDVIDTGMGMTRPQQQRIFAPFTQADSSTTRRFGGTGLGLTIGRRLAELMGGSLKLVRSQIDEGTHFRVILPFQRHDLDAQQSGTETSEASVQQDKSPSKPLTGCNILLVDDGIDNQRLFSTLLTKAGADVTLAENGRDAVNVALRANDEHNAFNIILMDMQMPVMDGYTATRALRDAGYSAPILALTAHAMADDRAICLQAGCDDYLSKPTNRRDLVEMVLRYVTLHPAQT